MEGLDVGVARRVSTTETRVTTIDGDAVRERFDRLATEEPLEIRVVTGRERRTVAVTMRTPGNDFELAAGFLLAEGVVERREEIRSIRYCVDRELDEAQRFNVVNVELAALPELAMLDRHFLTTSACGVCGKASLEALALRGVTRVEDDVRLDRARVAAIPDTLRAGQRLFASTGGLHAAGLIDASGKLVAVREDVGRHNAVDKLIGWGLLEGRLPFAAHALAVSGRSSYEIVQKALSARVPVVCAVSAPSSLAVDLAREFGVTLVGFMRGTRFNVYAGSQRILG